MNWLLNLITPDDAGQFLLGLILISIVGCVIGSCFFGEGK